MTGRELEREQRAAFLFSSVSPIGVSPLMPPHSQGAERRRKHRISGLTGTPIAEGRTDSPRT